MDTNKSVAILLAFILLAACNVSCKATDKSEPEQKFERENREIPNNVTASCVVKITSNPTVLYASDRTIERLLNSSGIAGKAAREVAGISLDTDGVVSIEHLSIAEDGLINVFNLTVYDIEPGEEFMNAVIKNLSLALHNDYEQSIQQLRDQRMLAENEASRAEADLVSFQKELRELAGSRGSLSRQAIVEEIDKLRDIIQRAEFDIEYSRASMDYSRQKSAQVRTELNTQLENDTIIRDLEKLIKGSATRLDTAKLQQQAGRSTASDLADLEEKLVRLRIELAKRREELSKSAGADELDKLNEEIAEYSRRIADRGPFLQVHREQLEVIQNLLEEADRFEILAIKAEHAKENFKEAIKLRDKLRRKIRMVQPPVVSVLGGL